MQTTFGEQARDTRPQKLRSLVINQELVEAVAKRVFEESRQASALAKRKKKEDKLLEKPTGGTSNSPAPDSESKGFGTKHKTGNKERSRMKHTKEPHRKSKGSVLSKKVGYLRTGKVPSRRTNPKDNPRDLLAEIASSSGDRSVDSNLKQIKEFNHRLGKTLTQTQRTSKGKFGSSRISSSDGPNRRGRPPRLSATQEKHKSTIYIEDDDGGLRSQSREGMMVEDVDELSVSASHLLKSRTGRPKRDGPHVNGAQHPQQSHDRGTWDSKIEPKIYSQVKKSELWVLLSKDAANCPPDGQFPQIDWKMVDKKIGPEPSMELFEAILEPIVTEMEDTAGPGTDQTGADNPQESNHQDHLIDEALLKLLSSCYLQRSSQRAQIPVLVENMEEYSDKRVSYPVSVIVFETEPFNIRKSRSHGRPNISGWTLDVDAEEEAEPMFPNNFHSGRFGNGFGGNALEVEDTREDHLSSKNLSYKKSQKWNKFTCGMNLYSWWNLLTINYQRNLGPRVAAEPSGVEKLSTYLPGVGAPVLNEWPPHSQAGRVLQSQAESRDRVKKLASALSAETLVILSPEVASELLLRQRYWARTIHELNKNTELAAQTDTDADHPEYAYTVRAEKQFLQERLRTLTADIKTIVEPVLSREMAKIPSRCQGLSSKNIADDSMKCARQILLMKTLKLQREGIRDKTQPQIQEHETRVTRAITGNLAPEVDCGICFLSSSHPYSVNSPLIDCEGKKNCQSAFHKSCYQIISMNSFTVPHTSKRSHQNKQTGNSSVCIPCQYALKQSSRSLSNWFSLEVQAL